MSDNYRMYVERALKKQFPNLQERLQYARSSDEWHPYIVIHDPSVPKEQTVKRRMSVFCPTMWNCNQNWVIYERFVNGHDRMVTQCVS